MRQVALVQWRSVEADLSSRARGSRDDLCYTPVVELRRMLIERRLSAEDLTSSLLSRIGEVNGALNAIVALRPEAALAEARAVDRSQATDGLPLAGIPFTVKDLNETSDLPTTLGSRPFDGHRAGFDAEIVTRLRTAGGILLGKTNTPEFGLRATTENLLFGTTRNPWSLGHNPGGSSGGAAAAIAAGISPLAQGSDGGGSIRGPAFCCGVVGLKPTRGRVPGAPSSYEGWAGLATDGPMARTVRDVALMLDVMAGPVTGEPYGLAASTSSFLGACERPPSRLRLAYSMTPASGSLHPEVRKSVLGAITALSDMGHELTEAGPDLGGLYEPFMTIVAAQTAAMTALIPAGRLGDLEPTTLELMFRGQGLTAADYCSAINLARNRSARIMEFWEDYDLLVTPTAIHLAFPNGWSSDDLDERWQAILDFDAFMYPFNVTGQPAISVPCGWSKEGLPIGLQIVGRFGGEAAVLSLAAAFEEARPWAARRPTLLASAGGGISER